MLHFQPIASLADGGVRHYEALLRLDDDPAGGLVAPGRFLPAAERSGIVREIDRMVLRKAVARLADLAGGAGPELAIAINVSALSVTDGRTLAALERELALQRVDPQRLIVEVTETVAISDMRRARAFCAGVQRLGCAIALDDFGAGFGSFQYLKHLPFSYLKIDGGFIRALTVSRTDQLVVRALVGLVRGMGASHDRRVRGRRADARDAPQLRGRLRAGLRRRPPRPAIGCERAPGSRPPSRRARR